MSTAKVIELISEGTSIENALENAVKDAGKTLHGIKSVYVENITAVVDDKKIVKYRLNVKVTFILDD